MEGVLKTAPTLLVATTVPAIRAMFLEVMGMPAMVSNEGGAGGGGGGLSN